MPCDPELRREFLEACRDLRATAAEYRDRARLAAEEARRTSAAARELRRALPRRRGEGKD